jgi:hypothetical protein
MILHGCPTPLVCHTCPQAVHCPPVHHPTRAEVSHKKLAQAANCRQAGFAIISQGLWHSRQPAASSLAPNVCFEPVDANGTVDQCSGSAAALLVSIQAMQHCNPHRHQSTWNVAYHHVCAAYSDHSPRQSRPQHAPSCLQPPQPHMQLCCHCSHAIHTPKTLQHIAELTEAPHAGAPPVARLPHPAAPP